MKVQDGQNMADVAIQEYGTLEAVVDLAQANGMGVTDYLPAGHDLHIPKRVYNQRMMTYCKTNQVQPATSDSTVRFGPFSEQFNPQFE